MKYVLLIVCFKAALAQNFSNKNVGGGVESMGGAVASWLALSPDPTIRVQVLGPVSRRSRRVFAPEKP